MPFSISLLTQLTPEDRQKFKEDGFIVIENALDQDQIARLRASFPRLFKGDFDTGVYPDEWHWREGVSLPDVTRHIGNAWKSDLAIANLALSSDIGRAAAFLTGWPGVKLGQDTIWWKPAGTKAGTFHQDSSYMDFLNPSSTVTCWFTLDNTYSGGGTLEYVKGSHKWPLTKIPPDFLAPENYREPMLQAASSVGVADPEIIPIEVPAGSCVIHAGEIWHGSEANTSGETMRRSVGVHMIPENALFTDARGGYIYRRYQRVGSRELEDSFFPTLYSSSAESSEWIGRYCETGKR
jgi:ectoine hydroxylase-related dioxygenase (phytanoyl-CoA dioxygenase family)